MPTSGGVYGYIEAAFGPLTGYIAGMLSFGWGMCSAPCGGVAAALADVGANWVSSLARIDGTCLGVIIWGDR